MIATLQLLNLDTRFHIILKNFPGDRPNSFRVTIFFSNGIFKGALKKIENNLHEFWKINKFL